MVRASETNAENGSVYFAAAEGRRARPAALGLTGSAVGGEAPAVFCTLDAQSRRTFYRHWEKRP